MILKIQFCKSNDQCLKYDYLQLLNVYDIYIAKEIYMLYNF